MDKGAVGKAVFVCFGFDQKEDFFFFFVHHVIVSVYFVVILRGM